MIFSSPLNEADDFFQLYSVGEIFNSGEDFPGKTKDEQLLFPGAFGPNHDDPFVPEQEENLGIATVKETPETGADTIRETCTGSDSGEYLGHQLNLDTLGTLASTTLPAPPVSYSNPETPIEPFEMSLNAASPAMTRILSEQSALAPHKLKGVNNYYQPAPISPRQTPPAPLSSSVSIARAQAGPERSAQFEPPQRQIRTPIGRSNLRTSVSADPGNQSGSHSPQVLTQDMYPYPYQAQVHTQEGWDRVRRSGYSDLHQVNSPYMGISSSYSDNVLHGGVTHGGVNFPPRSVNLLLPHPTAHLLNTAYYHTTSNAKERSSRTMKNEESSSEYGPSRLKYQCFRDARREKKSSTHNAVHDNTFPRSDDQECNYVERIMDAMLDTSMAEDNGGMKRTWETMKRDKDKVEKAAWEIVNVCKERHKRNGPFESSPKASRQFDSFEERIQAICEAVQSQKTMCKHLLRQPFVEEVVEDPIAATSRIKNNRKVNHGKKEAINKGRQALGERALGKGRKYSKAISEDEDEDLEDEHDDEYGIQAVNLPKRRSPAQRRRSQATSDDQNYGEGPAPKKVRRSSNSMYQVNEYNQMIDTSIPQPRQERHLLPQTSSQAVDLNSGTPYPWASIQGPPGQGTHKELFTGTDFDGHQQAEMERRHSAGRR